MITVKQACSDIINSLNAYNLDDKLSYRFVKNLLFDKAAVFVKQDSVYRSIFKLNNLWKPIDCVEFEDGSLTDCYKDGCTSLKVSTIKIPDTYQTSYGYALKVFNVNYSKEFNLIQPQLYRDIKNRPFPTNNGYFWIQDGYIYIPDSDIEVGIVLGMFKEDALLKDCECPKPLDSTFAFPDYIVTIAKQEVLKELLGGNKQISKDDIPDLNQKTR
jgi:hypothetical protein